ncbi:uncharacterized protein cdhr5-rs isoform X3 [Dicentrarchus labrax]|uniref:uncharacterized protein cdhr5-rs isoform X3 n=1 Tax=Dicentrarchus labrax TaxID=13489 RepID=UPI0021F506ED|nr:uncharacterized protein cdhr5-rs isoform X3 [Dicentrarchus labrax]
MLRPCRLLLWQVALRLSYHVVTASLCLGGSDIFSSVRENSPMGEFIANLNVRGEPGTSAVRLCLTGEYADWFYLEGRTIRLNTSASRVLDREVLGSVLIAELTCYEDDVIQSQYRIVVEIVNENDNKPHFLEETIPPFTVNELTAVNSVVFSVKAVDADGDMISYIIDQSSRDAWFFRIDLPNSGNVVLNKALDYETRTQLQVIIWAQEANTVEKFNMSTVLTVNIEDGDDQYPYFLPCTPVSPAVPVCMSPTYTANITHKQQDVVLEFSPGPIRAEDGDRGVNTPLTFSILSGQSVCVQVCRVVYRCVWVCTGVYRCVQVCTGVYECVQVCTDVYRCVRVCTGVYECVQVCTSVYRCLQVCTDVYRCVRVCTGVYRCVQMCTSVYRCVRVCTGVYRCVQVCTSVYRCLQVCTDVYKCVQVCTGVYECVQVCTGVYRCVEVCTGVYMCVELCTGVYRCPCVSAGGDRGRFVINNSTGEIRLTRPVNSQPMMTNFTLTVMVCQVNDRLKYSVASALVRVLSENMFPPVFNRTTFKGFIIQSSSPASIVSTYGNQVLQVQVSDRDFTDGRNPNIHYSLHPPSGLYQITQGGVLIARTDQLHAFDRHILQVVARDEESGDEVSASVDIEVLQRGQQVPRGAFTEQPLFGDVDSRLAGGIAAMILLLFLSSALFLLLRTVRRRRQRNADEHTPVALGKHPNVTLSWFHTVSSSRPAFSADESPFSSRSFRQQSSSKSGSFHGRQGVYTRRQSLLPPPSSSPSSPSSSNISSVPGGRSRPHTDLFPVPEKPEGQPEDTETLRFYDTRGGVQGPGGDITAETLRETTT